MTTTPNRPTTRDGLVFKAARVTGRIGGGSGGTFSSSRGGWNEADHPRDRLGRFIETGAEVRVWGGIGGTVVRNVGGGRIEIERADGQHAIVHRNYLTVVSRPDGSAPTDQRSEDVTPLTEEAADPAAVEEATPETPDVATGQMGEEVATGIDDQQVADEVRSAATAYETAVSNNIPDDEADERAALLAALDKADAAGADEAAVDRLREAATAEPTDQPGEAPALAQQAQPGDPAPGSQVLVPQPNEGEQRQVGVQTFTVGQPATGPGNRSGSVVGFTDAGGVILRDENGNDWPFKPDAQVTPAAQPAQPVQQPVQQPAPAPAAPAPVQQPPAPDLSQSDRRIDGSGRPDPNAPTERQQQVAAGLDDERLAAEIARVEARDVNTLPPEQQQRARTWAAAIRAEQQRRQPTPAPAEPNPTEPTPTPEPTPAYDPTMDRDAPEAPLGGTVAPERVEGDEVGPGDINEGDEVQFPDGTTGRVDSAAPRREGRQRLFAVNVPGEERARPVMMQPDERATRISEGDETARRTSVAADGMDGDRVSPVGDGTYTLTGPDRPIELNLRPGDRVLTQDSRILQRRDLSSDPAFGTPSEVARVDRGRITLTDGNYIDLDRPGGGGSRSSDIRVVPESFTGSAAEAEAEFDPATDERLAEVHEVLESARLDGVNGVTQVGLLNRAADMISGYRAGTRGDATFTPEESERLRVWRGEIVAEREQRLTEARERAARGETVGDRTPETPAARTESLDGVRTRLRSWAEDRRLRGTPTAAANARRAEEIADTPDADLRLSPGGKVIMRRESDGTWRPNAVANGSALGPATFTVDESRIDAYMADVDALDIPLGRPEELVERWQDRATRGRDQQSLMGLVTLYGGATPPPARDEPVTVVPRREDPGVPIPPRPEEPETPLTPEAPELPDGRVPTGQLPVAAFRSQADAEEAGYVYGRVETPGDVEVGQVVVARTRGRQRAARVVSTARTRATLEYTTEGAINEQIRIRDAWASLSPDAEYRRAYQQGQRNWDFYNDLANRTDEEHAKIEAARGFPIDGDFVRDSVARFGRERETRKQWIAEHPNREDHATAEGEKYREQAQARRDQARAWTDDDLRNNAHRTTVTVAATALAVHRDSLPAEPETPDEPVLDEAEVDPRAPLALDTPLGVSRVAALMAQTGSRSRFNESHQDNILTVLNDPQTVLSADGGWFIYRHPNGERQWHVATAGDLRSIGRFGQSGTREEALDIASRLAALRTRDNKPFPSTEADTPPLVASWRSDGGQSLAEHARLIRDDVRPTEPREEDWTDPVERISSNPFDEDATTAVMEAAAAGEVYTDHLSDWDDQSRHRAKVRTIVMDEHSGVPIGGGGNFIVGRNPNGKHNWVLMDTGRFDIIATGNSREEMISLASAVQERIQNGGRLDAFGNPSMVTGWTHRRTGHDLPGLVGVARSFVGRGVWDARDWEDPVSPEADPLRDQRPRSEDEGPVSADPTSPLDPSRVSAEQMQQNMMDAFSFTHSNGWSVGRAVNQHDGEEVPIGYASTSEWDDDRWTFSSPIVNAEGRVVGQVNRSVFRNYDGELEVHHDLLTIEREFQGQGFADAYYKHLYDQYETRGIEVVTIQANIDVGGYAWAQRGFDWDTSEGEPSYYARSRIVENLTSLTRAGVGDQTRTPAEIARINELIRKINDGGLSPKDIANSLRDIEWSHELPGGTRVRMWPGKYAMLGTNWHGKFYVNQRVVPTIPQFRNTGLDLDTAELAEIIAERDMLRDLRQQMIDAGADHTNADLQLLDVRNGEVHMAHARAHAAEGSILAMSLGANTRPDTALAALNVDDWFISPSLSTDEPILWRLREMESDGFRMRVVVEDRDGNVSEHSLTPYQNVTVVLMPQAPEEDPDPTGSPLIGNGVSEADARRNLRNMFTYTHPESGWTTDYDNVSVGDTRSYMTGRIRDRNGVQVGSVQRSVYINSDGEVEVHHDYLSIGSEHQGQGFADAFYKHLYEQYENRGVDVVTIDANIDVGGYAWAQRGFNWASGNMPSGLRAHAVTALQDIANGRRPNAARDLTPEQRQQVNAFANRILSGEQFTAKDIANALRDVTWQHTLSNGREITMWPGKHVLLGRMWAGAFRVRDREVRTESGPPVTIASTDVTTLSDAELRAETEQYLGDKRGINFLTDGGYETAAEEMVARLQAVQAEQTRRYVERGDALLDNPENADAANLSEGDEIILPRVVVAGSFDPRFADSDQPERVMVNSVTEINDEMGRRVMLNVTHSDGTVRAWVLTTYSGFNVRRDGEGEPARVEQVPITSLQVNDRVLTEDYRTGRTVVVTVSGAPRDNGDYWDMDVQYEDGTTELFSMSPDALMPRVHGDYVVNPPETPALPLPEDMSDDDLARELQALEIANIRTLLSSDVTFTDADEARMHLLRQEAHVRRGEQRDTPEDNPPSADEQPMGVAEHEPGTRTARPVLYTYQRRNIVALDLDLNGTDHPLEVKRAAARIRARKPLSASESAALARYLHDLGADESLGVRKRRMYTRLAMAMDASTAHANGQRAPYVKGQNVTRGKPAGLLAGDLIALPARDDGAIEQFTVNTVRSMMGGRLVEVELVHENGDVERRLLQRDQRLYIMPNLPPPTPEEPEQEWAREYVGVTDINVGDTVTVMVTGEYHDVVITQSQEDGAGGWELTFDVDYGYGMQSRSSIRDEGDLIVRVARGDLSGDQPTATRVGPDEPQDIDEEEVVVGDRIGTNTGATQYRGVVLSITEVANDMGFTSRVFSVLDDTGSTLTIHGSGTTVQRLKRADEDVSAAIAAARRDVEMRGIRRNVTGHLSDMQGHIYNSLANSASLAVGHSREQVIREITSDRVTDSYNVGHALNMTQLHLSNAHAGQAELITNLTTAARDALTEDARRKFIEAVRDSQPLPGEAEHEMLARIVAMYRDTPPRRDSEGLARALTEGMDAALSADLGDPSKPDPTGAVEIDDDADLQTRIAAYRTALGPGTFGHTQVRRAGFGDLDVDALERGEAPEVQWVTSEVRDNADDGGPGAHTMQQVEIVRAAGRDMRARIDSLSAEVLDEIAGGYDGEFPFDPRDESADNYLARQQAQVGIWERVAAERYAAYTGGGRSPEARENWQQAVREKRNAEERVKVARKIVGEVRRVATHRVLASVRDLGGARIPVDLGARTISTNRERHERLLNGIRHAEDMLPTDWIESIAGYVRTDTTRSDGSLEVLAADRGGAYRRLGRIELSDRTYENNTLSGDGSTAVGVHELTHFAEYAVPGIIDAERAFLWSRTSTGDVATGRQREPLVNMATHRGDRTQNGYIDEFAIGYAGVDYLQSRRAEAYELMTLGVESLFGGSAYLDEDYEHFVLGVLATIGAPKAPREDISPIADPGQTRTAARTPRTPRTPRDPSAPPAARRGRSRVVTPYIRLQSNELQRMGQGMDPATEQALKDTFGFDHAESGLRVGELNGYTNRTGARVQAAIVDADGNRVGTVTRSIKYHRSGRIEVHHDYLQLDRERQGQGFADAYYKHLNEQYERLAVTDVTMLCNIDIGGYAWAQRGFAWASRTSANRSYYGMRTRLRSLLSRDDLSEAQKAEIQALIDRLGRMRTGTEPWLSPKDLANALKHITWQAPIGAADPATGERRMVTMWPGKILMLGTGWNGILRTGIRRQPTG